MRYLTNYHSHTTYCDARCNMEEFVATAIWLGFDSYGISPHSPIPIGSSANMRMDRVSDFLADMNRLKEKYAGKIELYTGMEIDYFGMEWNSASNYFSSLPLDYRIGAVHFIKDKDDRFVDIDCPAETFRKIVDECFDGDIRLLVERYFDTMRCMISAGGYDFIAHPDKISMNSEAYSEGITEKEWYVDMLHSYYRFIAEQDVLSEVNTKSFYTKGFLFPNKKWFKYLNSLGIRLVMNSDAHIPMLMTQGFEEVGQMLKESGYKFLMRLESGRWCENPL